MPPRLPPAPDDPPPRPGRANAEGLRAIRLGGQVLEYRVKRVRRRTIGIVVNEQGLEVRAPRWVGLAEIEDSLRANTPWVLRKLQAQRERAARQLPMRMEWRDGAALPYLGETITLLLDPRQNGAHLQATQGPQADLPQGQLPGTGLGVLHVGLPDTASTEQVRDAVQCWFKREALALFTQRCAHYAPQLGVQVRRLGLSSASTRWGSAGADGSIRLNWRLIHFALPIIDYVVVHELAHLREMNHGPAFWDVVASVVPDFKQRRGQLDQAGLPRE